MNNFPNGYDRIADRWNQARKAGFFDNKYIELFIDRLQAGANILDVGCGAGVPIAQYLVNRGYVVTGIDNSVAMLELAQHQVPKLRPILSEIIEFQPTVEYAGIVAWDSIFHIPRDLHDRIFKRLYDWLLPNGMLLISLGGSAWEGTIEMFGCEFFCSGFEPDNSLKLLQQVNFEIFTC